MTQVNDLQPFTRVDCTCGECGKPYVQFKQVDFDGSPIYRGNDDGTSVHPLIPDAADKYFCNYKCAYVYLARIHYGNTDATDEDISST